MQELVTINELAKLLKTSTSTIYTWVSQDRIPHLKIGKCLRFDPEQVLKFFTSEHNKSNKRIAL